MSAEAEWSFPTFPNEGRKDFAAECRYDIHYACKGNFHAMIQGTVFSRGRCACDCHPQTVRIIDFTRGGPNPGPTAR